MTDDVLTRKPPAHDARLKYGADENQFGDLRLPKGKGAHPLLMNIHGGFWRAKYDLHHASHLCAALAATGFGVQEGEHLGVACSGRDGLGPPQPAQAGAGGVERAVDVPPAHRHPPDTHVKGEEQYG